MLTRCVPIARQIEGCDDSHLRSSDVRKLKIKTYTLLTAFLHRGVYAE